MTLASPAAGPDDEGLTDPRQVSRQPPGPPRTGLAAGYPVMLRVDPALVIFLRVRPRKDRLQVRYDGTSSLGHVVESVGVPLPEVGELLLGSRRAQAGERIPVGETVTVRARPRPQPLPGAEPRFCLDVHLGTLARRLRLLGLDAWYRNSAGDDELITRAAADERMLLTQDRALLRQRAVRHGAFVRGADPDSQLLDVLDRFAPALDPWTRCPTCNGRLLPVAMRDVEHLLQPGTRRTYREFARCQQCGQPYWHGAHSRRLDTLVEQARLAVARRVSAGGPEGGTGTAQAPSGMRK